MRRHKLDRLASVKPDVAAFNPIEGLHARLVDFPKLAGDRSPVRRMHQAREIADSIQAVQGPRLRHADKPLAGQMPLPGLAAF